MKIKMGIACKSYNLSTESGAWLGQIILSSDGMFSAVTDWGNFAFAWRSFGEDFKNFILNLDVQYFAGKMLLSNADIWTSRKKAEMACTRFAEKILPALKAAIKKEMEEDIDYPFG